MNTLSSGIGRQEHILKEFMPITAKTGVSRQAIGPCAYDCVKFAVIRDGSAILCSQLGQQPVTVGDVVLLCSNTLCAAEPEDRCTVSTILIDTDYMIDHLFWKHAGLLSDRLEAKDLVTRLYLEPVQVLRFGVQRLEVIEPWLDELACLSARCRYVKRFNRIQALWFLIADVLSPFIEVSPVRLLRSQRERLRSTLPRHRRFVPLRSEVMAAAAMMRGDLAHRWTVRELADRVHLSQSWLPRVFADAYGKTPMAFLTMLRVEELARLLRGTDLLVEDAIKQVGWHSMSYAIRVFRAYMGMTPGAYRRTHNVVA
jgi:AraC family transcriptional regulator